MDKKKYSCYHSKIESSQDLSKFREDNKDKIPEVKKNSGDTYYFSHKKGNEILVTGLPKSEKGWKLDDLIRLKGDCLVPRSKTAADHKPKGFKSSDVNKCDIEKALELPNRDWKYLVDHASKLELHIESKIADESQSTLLTATGPAYSNLGGDVRSVEVVGLTTTDVLSSPPSSCKRQKLMPCDSNASLAANLVPPYPVCSDYESSILSEAAAGNSKVTTDYVNHEQGSEDQETVDQSKKNINSVDQHLKHKSFEEARSLGAESFLRLSKMHAGTFYFSHRETTTVLVTGLNKSEQARKDDLISVTGDWEKGAGDTDALHYLVPMTKAAAHKPTGPKYHGVDAEKRTLNCSGRD
ncbi:hypothetical protein FEM48_Zijuj05G0161100 [Ziziphus jujuba var. spinosa]|uniref:Uncharacterized protein n=1 Tax=Ziziphus jujuba var. spinosa TaxID=714518 RepID=A0A978VFS8_ZIZJJ|nr:hypothetical protein FEM48_Zijuj05G0161100 [Ziziphus jujuba var. spinosa]